MRFNRRYTNGRIMDGSMDYICERIATTYIETGRTMRSLASEYRCSPATICNYLNKYARNHLPYDMYKQVQSRARLNKNEAYENGRSENYYSDELGSLD